MPHPDPPLSSAMLDAAVELIGRAGARASVAIAGVSMDPTFSGVERLAVVFAPDPVRFGDVLVFRQRGKLVVHRLIQKPAGGRRLRTRGDGTIALDPWLSPEDVIGRVLAIEYADGVWRGLRARRTRLYHGGLAVHGLFWGLLGAMAWKVGGDVWRSRLGRVDRLALGVVHATLFRAFNPVIPAPDLDARDSS